MSGVIKLMHEGSQLQWQAYKTEYDKSTIIGKWKILYGPSFKKGEVVDEPDAAPSTSPFKKGSIPFSQTKMRGMRNGI